MKAKAAVLTAALGLLTAAGASADTNPAVNRVIVQQAVQQQMDNQLQVEAQQLQMQQQRSQASLAQQMQQQFLTQQYLMQQNQLLLIQLRAQLNAQRALTAHRRRPPGPSH